MTNLCASNWWSVTDRNANAKVSRAKLKSIGERQRLSQVPQCCGNWEDLSRLDITDDSGHS